MDVQEYISSGILESYVLGNCSKDEIEEVERLIFEYESIRQEIASIRTTLELTSMLETRTPNPALKSNIWEAIRSESEELIQDNLLDAKHETSVFTSHSDSNWLKYAAGFTLLFSISSISIYYFSEFRKAEKLLLTTQQELLKLNHADSIQEEKLHTYQAKLELIAHPSTLKIALTGVPTSKDSKATVFWNPARKEVLLSGIDLPKHPADKTYQLWALVDGVPVDAGVFDSNAAKTLIPMKSIDQSQAFAITLEPKGGSKTPHLEALCVIGNVL